MARKPDSAVAVVLVEGAVARRFLPANLVSYCAIGVVLLGLTIYLIVHR